MKFVPVIILLLAAISAGAADIGIGNNPNRAGQSGTFTKSAQNYKQALLYVFIEPETQTK